MIEEGIYFTIDGRKVRIDRWEKGVYFGWVAENSKFLPAEWNGQGICLENEANSIVSTISHPKFCRMLSISQKNLRKLQYLEGKGELSEELNLLTPIYQDKKIKAYGKSEAIKYVEKNKRRLEKLLTEVEAEQFEDTFGRDRPYITFDTDNNLGLAFLTGRLNPIKQPNKGKTNV